MIFYMKINIKVFYKLIVLFLLVIAIHAQSTQNSKFVIFLYIRKKKGRDEVDLQINISYKLILLILVGIAKPAQNTQNNKFAKFLQYLKKEATNEVGLCADEQFSMN